MTKRLEKDVIEKMKNIISKIIMFLKKQPPGRLIALGFALVILFGTCLLLMPFSVRNDAEVSFVNALFTSTSAVCVTGLIAIDTADHFTPFGQGVVAALIQVGGLGVTSIGVGLMIAAGKRVGLKSRNLVKEALNVDNYRGIVRLVKSVLILTLCFEAAGALLSFIVFSRDYSPLHALGISVFHSIAAFNNSGFDILGGLRNLIPYQTDILLNLTTCFLIIFGGLGFLVILDILKQRSFPQAFSPLQGGYYDECGTAYRRNASSESDRRYFVAWSVFSQRFGQNCGIFNISDRRIYQCRALCPVRSYVYRSVTGLYGRRYKDEYIFCYVSGSKKYVYQNNSACFPQKYLKRKYYKSVYDNDPFGSSRMYSCISDVCA